MDESSWTSSSTNMFSSCSSSSLVSERDSRFTSSPSRGWRGADLKDFDLGDARGLLLQLKRKGLDETLTSLLETIVEISCAELRCARRRIDDLAGQVDSLNAQVDFLMKRRNDDTTLRLMNAARRVLVRGFQILFPKVYRDEDVYFEGNRDGSVNWSGFKDLVRSHEKLLKTGCLPMWNRLADRQDEILDGYREEFEHDAFLGPTTSSMVEGVLGAASRSVGVHNRKLDVMSRQIEAHIGDTFSFLLSHCEARFAAMVKLRETSEQQLETIFKIFPGATSIPELVQAVEKTLRKNEEMLSAFENSFDKASDGGSMKTHVTNQSDDTLENDADDTHQFDGASERDILISHIESVSDCLKEVIEAQKVVADAAGLNAWIVQSTFLIMKSNAIGLIDNPLYGLSCDGSKFLETMYTTRNVPLSKEMLRSELSRDDAARLLESILTRTTDNTAEANGRPP